MDIHVALLQLSPSLEFPQHCQTLRVHGYSIPPAQPQAAAGLVGPQAATVAAQSGLISTARQTSYKLLVIMQGWQAAFYLTYYLQNS